MAAGTLPAADEDPTVGAVLLVGVESFVAGPTAFGWTDVAEVAAKGLIDVMAGSPSAEPSHHASRSWIVRRVHPSAGLIEILLVDHGQILAFDSYGRLTDPRLHEVRARKLEIPFLQTRRRQPGWTG